MRKPDLPKPDASPAEKKIIDMTVLETWSAEDQVRAIRERVLSPTELVDMHLERIEHASDTFGAFLLVDHEGARLAARALEQQLVSWKGDELPPLFGVPISIKDTWPVAGLRFTAGSAAFADRVASADAMVVKALRDAGCIVLGKTNAAEFGCSSFTENTFGISRSPFDRSRGAGGSSGGAAAAVAAGFGAIALGSDGGGSIRIPAASCGVVGLKPSRGRITTAPGPDSAGLATAGPLARTVADVARLLDVMTGSAPGDSCSLSSPAKGYFRSFVDREPRQLAVGIVLPREQTDPVCIDTCHRLGALLESLGHRVEIAEAASADEYMEAFKFVWSVLAASVPVPDEDEARLLALTQWLRQLGRSHNATDLMAAQSRLLSFGRAIASRYHRYDIVLSPTLTRLPPKVGDVRDDRDPQATFHRMSSLHPLTPVANITGQPSMNLPLCWSEPSETAPAGLPIGMMLTAKHEREDLLISLGAQLERALPWSDRYKSIELGPSSL